MKNGITDMLEMKNNETFWKKPLSILDVSKVCF